MDSVEVTALSGVHRCETSGAVNLGQPWHWKPSSSSDRRHNSLLPAATQFNDFWGTLSEATNAEKSILSQGRFDKHNFFFPSVFKTPLVVENSIVWDEVKIVLFWFWFFFFAFFICLHRLLCSCRPRLLHCGALFVPGERLETGVMEGSRYWKKLGYKNLI